jgi:hypothetical protein
MPAPLPNKIAGKSEWLAAAVITLAIVGLHFYFWRHVGGLWRDEVNTVNLSQSGSLAAMTHDSFPILMPLLVKIWSALGTADLSLRLLGMLFGLAIPAAFWAVARATRQPPLFSLVLFGLNALLICYGDSLRGYGLGTALIVLALAAMWSFLKNPTWPRAGWLALAATLSVQALYQNAVLLFAIGLGAFAVCARQKNYSAALKISCAGLVAALSLLPYSATLASLPHDAIELRRGFSPLITSLNFEMATGFPFEGFAAVWKMLAVIVVGLTLLSLRRANAKEKSAETNLALFASVTLVAVIVLFLGFLWFAAVVARPWYFLPPLALAAVCFDLGIPFAALPRLVRVAGFAFLVGTALVALPAARQDLRGHFTNADQLAARVATAAAPQDFVVVTPWFCGISFNRYFRTTIPWTTLPPMADHATHRYDMVLAQMQDTNSLAPVLEKISATLRAGHRVWVVEEQMSLPPAGALAPPILPPPPLPDYGWSDTPYTASWSARTAYFLSRHAVRFGESPGAESGAVFFQEPLHLLVAEGWRD